jgi:hypothetical protein
MKRRITSFLTLFFTLVMFSFAQAGGLTWKDHQAPFDLIFANHIDTHQQTKVLPNDELIGYLYVEFTGEYTDDGFPIAKHTDCNDSLADCTAGWQWRGVPGTATFAYHEMGDHPLWLVERDQIPQPGAYSHFHWLGDPAMASDLMENMSYDGYFLELKATNNFAFEHGDDLIVVKQGLDLATHLNLVTVFPEVVDDGGDDNGH